MSQSFETKPPFFLPRFGLIVTAAAGLLLITYYTWYAEPNQVAPVQSSIHKPAVFGPTTWIKSVDDDSQVVQIQVTPPGGLAINDDQSLVVNAALLDVINFFLLEQTGDDRVTALRAYLKKKLPLPACDEALQILDHYQRYMKAHDDLLKAQNLGAGKVNIASADLHRIAIWSDQRDRLRQSILGSTVAQAWYQNDDSQLKQILEELPQGTADSNTGSLRSEHPRPMWANKRDEISHNLYMQSVLDRTVKSFDVLAQEGPQWMSRYTAYLNAANQVNQNAKLSLSERTVQIQALLLKYFSTETERLRARELTLRVAPHKR